MKQPNLWRRFGPGILLAATTIGASHLVLSPQAGAPVLYALNIYCGRNHIKDPKMRPALTTIVIGWMGIVFMIVALGVTVYVKCL